MLDIVEFESQLNNKLVQQPRMIGSTLFFILLSTLGSQFAIADATAWDYRDKILMQCGFVHFKLFYWKNSKSKNNLWPQNLIDFPPKINSNAVVRFSDNPFAFTGSILTINFF